ncbi:MAG: lectin like domain-containing protein, partial [bacterium]
MGLKKQITKKAVAIFLTFATAMTAVSPRMVSADTPKEMEADAFEYEDEVFEGYLAAPWDEERVAPVDKNLHYIDVQEMLVDWDDAQTTDAEKNAGEESGEPQPTDSPEPTDTPEPTDPPEPTPRPSRFPDFDTEDEILAYLTGRYPATRNQTTDGVHYGNCWAHAACTLAEFYLINHNIQDKTGPVTKDVNYSELQLAYFAYHNCPEPISGPTEDSVFLDTTLGTKRNFLNFGGNLALGSQSLLRRKGYAADADEARYENAKNVLENGLSDDYADSRDLTYLKNAFVVNLWENASLLKEAIKANGAVGVTYNSDPKYLNPETNAYYNYEKDFFNHVVTAVGWDDGYPAANFKTLPPGDGAWLIRNSHSTDTRFSEESYFWISYYDTSLGQASYIYEMADPDKGEFYDNQYYYDGQLHSIKSVASTKVANIFIAQKETETLKAVQFDASEKAPGAYRVSIYKNLTDANNPESGILMEHAVTTGTLALPGKYTLPLAAEVPLSLGETFAVVVESENPIDRECDNLWKEQLVMDVTMHHQESFYFTNDAWVDLAEKDYKGARGNLCIRALTNDRADGLPEYIANLVLRDNTEDGLSLTWSAAKDAEGYVIRRLAENDGSGDEEITFDEYLSIGTTAANERAFTDTELLADIFCCYKSIPIVGGVLDEDGASPIIRVKRPLPTPKEIVLNETAL